jgi:cell division cycle 2-like
MWDEGFPLTSLREISILLELHHPNIVNVKEVVVGRNPNHVYMVMEYCEHELRTLLERNKPSFCLSECKRLLYQVIIYFFIKKLNNFQIIKNVIVTFSS